MKCKKCNSNNHPEAKHCINCGAPLTEESNTKDPFYSKTWFIVLMSLLFPIVGIILLWVCKKPKSKKNRIIATIVIALYCLFAFFGTFGSGSSEDTTPKKTTETKEHSTKKEPKGKTGIEVKKSADEKYGKISEFSYDISGGTIKLKKYNGKCKILEISPKYKVDGKTYKTDLSKFQVGIGNNRVESIIFKNGIKSIYDATFNSTNIKKVFFPSTMKRVDDKTLSYLHNSDGKEKIKIYYAGTEKDWYNIFKEYQRKTVSQAKSAEEVGESVADKINEIAGGDYNSKNYEFFFSASPNDLKTE